jgi:hypothetical protein
MFLPPVLFFIYLIRGRFRIAGQIATQEKGIEKGRISG